jgi:transposase-like protein
MARRSWQAGSEELAARGGRAPQLGLIDGGQGLRGAVEQTWPQATTQRCTVHKLRNLLTITPRRHDELRADYHAIVRAEDGAAAQRASTAFCRKWRRPVPAR